jgi:hypothetical protein
MIVMEIWTGDGRELTELISEKSEMSIALKHLCRDHFGKAEN